MKWKRSCPICSREISYSANREKIRAEKSNTKCKSCSKKGSNHPLYGKTRSEEAKRKTSESLKGKKRSIEVCKKTSGKRNGMYGKSFYDVWLEKYGKIIADKKMLDFKKKRKLQIMKPFSQESLKNMRLKAIKRIEKNRLNGGQLIPGYNSSACKIIEEYNKKYGFNFIHAENGGGKCIDGYFPDGIDEKRKTIIEIDEKHHFNSNGKLKKRDILRQNFFENLGYKVIRIKI